MACLLRPLSAAGLGMQRHLDSRTSGYAYAPRTRKQARLLEVVHMCRTRIQASRPSCTCAHEVHAHMRMTHTHIHMFPYTVCCILNCIYASYTRIPYTVPLRTACHFWQPTSSNNAGAPYAPSDLQTRSALVPKYTLDLVYSIAYQSILFMF